MARSFGGVRAAGACGLVTLTMAGGPAARADAVTGGVVHLGSGAAGVTLAMSAPI
jgi:hypothetical protein